MWRGLDFFFGFNLLCLEAASKAPHGIVWAVAEGDRQRHLGSPCTALWWLQAAVSGIC